jgi:hypothetical protein
MGSGPECVALPDLYSESEGDPCDVVDGPLCQAPLVCESASGTSGTCAAAVGSGETCRRAVPNQCPVSQYCDATSAGVDGSCVDLPGDGEACLSRGGRKLCADEHVCVSDVCRPAGGNGDDCEANAQCYSGACDAGLCAATLMCDAP